MNDYKTVDWGQKKKFIQWTFRKKVVNNTGTINYIKWKSISWRLSSILALFVWIRSMRIVLEEIIEFLLKNIKAVAIYPLHFQISLPFPYSISSVKTTRMNFFVRYMVTTLHIKGSTNFRGSFLNFLKSLRLTGHFKDLTDKHHNFILFKHLLITVSWQCLKIESNIGRLLWLLYFVTTSSTHLDVFVDPLVGLGLSPVPGLGRGQQLLQRGPGALLLRGHSL